MKGNENVPGRTLSLEVHCSPNADGRGTTYPGRHTEEEQSEPNRILHEASFIDGLRDGDYVEGWQQPDWATEELVVRHEAYTCPIVGREDRRWV